MEYIMDILDGMVLLLHILLVGKCCFEESFVLDKKVILVNFAFMVLYIVIETLFGENSIPSYVAEIFDFIIFAWTILRGGKGIIRRMKAFLQMFVFLLMTMVAMASILAMLYCTYIQPDANINDMAMYISVGFALIESVYVYWVLYKKQIYVQFQTAEKIGLFFIMVFVWVVYGLVLTAEEEPFQKLQSSFSVLIVVMLMVMYAAFMIAMIKNKTTIYYQQGQKFQEEWMKHELAYFKEYKKSQEETRRFRHDVMNNLTCISALLQEGKQEEVKQYLGNMLGEIHALSPKVVTGDEMLDCIISVKWERMAEEGIVFEADGVLDRGLNWEPIDICTVFSNALDNAIEACQKVSGQKIILLSLKRTKNFYYIEMKNSINKELVNIDEIRRGKLFTTKKDKDIHGFGLESIKKTIYNHNGELELVAEEKYFILRIMIPG